MADRTEAWRETTRRVGERVSTRRVMFQPTMAGAAANANGASPPRQGIPHQILDEGTEVPSSVRMRCTRCLITYESLRGKAAQCPLCDADARIRSLQQTLTMERQRSEHIIAQSHRQQAELNFTIAMADALPLTDQHDLMFLKAVLYLWRQDKQTQLRITHGMMEAEVDKPARKRSNRVQRPRANGFLLIAPHAEPEAHLCSSVGGAALAQYLDEASRATNVGNALAMLMRVMQANLAVGE